MGQSLAVRTSSELAAGMRGAMEALMARDPAGRGEVITAIRHIPAREAQRVGKSVV